MDIFSYTQSSGWKGILPSQQLMGSVGVQGYFLISLLSLLPRFSVVPAMAHWLVPAGAGLASGQQHSSEGCSESHRPGPSLSSNPRKSLGL